MNVENIQNKCQDWLNLQVKTLTRYDKTFKIDMRLSQV